MMLDLQKGKMERQQIRIENRSQDPEVVDPTDDTLCIEDLFLCVWESWTHFYQPPVLP